MKKIFIFLITGFEEIEAVATVDVLRRAGLEVQTVSLTEEVTVTGSHGVPVTADLLFDQVDFNSAELLVLPGGTVAYNDHEGVKKAISDFYGRGEKVAAICASPMVLGGLGILQGRGATCYPGFETYLKGADLRTDQAVVVDGQVITGKGPGMTLEFALTLVQILAGKSKRDKIAEQLLVG
ncbi:MAG: DJ-1/PfpI family protein [Rikenellaceae bacterium]|nr:DJ-1/PfpI family protein [Rikenellaceae bacterium]